MKSAEDAVNDFLDKNNVKLNQHQFDALVSFTHQYGENWWTKTPEKVLPKFIRQGNGSYTEADVRSTFALHDDPKRRAVEAEVFINGLGNCETKKGYDVDNSPKFKRNNQLF